MARTVLPGGLRVVTEHVAGARSAAVGLWVDVGSRDEPGFDPAARGAAHFLEHLLFKGTPRRTAREIAEAIDAVGGDLNAFTSKEHTCFYAHVLDSDLALAVDVVCDVVLNGVMDPADVELERDVVLSEIAGRDDDPEDLLADDFDDLLLGDHPLGGPVVGSEESVGDMTRDVLARFHGAHYVPSRSVLAVAGNVSHAEVLEAVAAAFGDRLTGQAAAAAARPGAPAVVLAPPDRLSVREDDTEQSHLMLGVPSLRRGDPRWEAQLVASTVLGGGTSSRLFQEVRERRGLAYSVYSAATGYSDLGVLNVYVGCAPERLGTAAGVLRTQLAELARHGITEAELIRAQGQLRGEYVLGLEDTPSRMSWLGRRELDGPAAPLDLGEALARVQAVTVDDVAAVASELFTTPVTAAVVGPYADVDDLPDEVREVGT
ncbi:pitrilysin family protein [Actinomycetospora sp. NBRC 106378]|uniref:M16 family metallopeptidase n=1 Tax=Actinomycetospora sp. NBRC 106378 TaxID=3032208 RepID=UPI0024A2F8FE|nr:pitrilysin family protein [Actinomycetospora sp. NBRC 106378]GLZ55744.1 peptidase M16 [Actinomycetospora sp. NBRC 106378]